ncbi:MAG: glycoside hydrolase family 36 protein [Acutalibacteraceae bacterium]|nr:glycoside hydrolase family 36 protein [Acutalibacteraceae bacterium]
MNYEILCKKDVTVSLAEEIKDGITFVTVNWHSDTPVSPEQFGVRFRVPTTDIYSTFSPSMREGRSLDRNYFPRKTDSRLASWMPLQQLVSLSGKNRLLIALSDAKIPTRITTGVRELEADSEITAYFFTQLTTPITDYTATIRIDMRDNPYYDSVYDTVCWWEKDCGYTSAFVPEIAKMPVNSLWYSYHQALEVESIIRECRLTKAMGMDTVIVDDGWQTEDNGGGYAYCGDWEPAPSKVGDMKTFIQRIHDTGMKVMIWYSVPYVGIYSKNYERFKDMMLDGTGDKKTYFSLDPRYKEVRDFLVKTYCDAVTDWKLDGLKLDFIDRFVLTGKSVERDDRRDTESLEEAIDILMCAVKDSLTAINPDILIEFRQTYVGPSIRKYGNMLRVTDCPNDSIKNRADSINLRLTSGKTAVHSDMLLWHLDDPVENAALQFVSSIFAVPQISMRIEELPDTHVTMLKYYLSFWRKWRDVLIDGKLTAENPEINYTQATSTLGNKSVTVPYCNTLVEIKTDVAVVLNATGGDCVLISGARGKNYRVVDCMGETLSKGTICADTEKISAPLCAQIFID